MQKKILIAGNPKFIAEIENILSRLPLDIENEPHVHKLIKRIDRRHFRVIILSDSFAAKNRKLYLSILNFCQQVKKKVIIVSSNKKTSNILEAKSLGVSDYILTPYHYRDFIARFNAVLNNKVRISCIGGGTGLFTLLMALKTIPSVLLTSIVSMSDNGGSSGRLRVSFGVLPPGDLRRSLAALSNAPEFMSEVMRYRFEKGEGLNGHNFGNLFLTVLSDIKGSMSEAVRAMGDILNTQGIVLPVTNTSNTLCALFEDGTVIKGETSIDLAEGRHPDLHIKNLWHLPQVTGNLDAYIAILNSDIVTIGPGDLFTSVITNLLVKNIREALQKSKAKKVYICNLMTKPGETAEFSAADHIKELTRYLGVDCLDYIIISNTKVSKKAIQKYAHKQQAPVESGSLDEIIHLTKAKVILADVGHETELVRHDPDKLKLQIKRLIPSLK
ncbi:MAG: uridine diphosphate-N-acetylglucosamine-binding protein YvcK [Candidatus Omnitrophica bacterium]|nr:uridine diphosphate-N-acetylglucosamine-binding protein YvcK [Candidatus Omnitrophota bacterium]